MARLRDRGTPLGGEHGLQQRSHDVRQRLFSPEATGSAETFELATPMTLEGATAPAFTLVAIGDLLDTKLGDYSIKTWI